ncbi:expressed unknown protein [Seminavis robusta]|uniref:Uncharacterized protein n=1 Tax=Seminavis robusta TaxID=568900 RepID=A0A9N8F357_9STRA|nr:expressed unknown protein [Seminavis robusta]|eukprot:Sro4099_g352881.1  (158) ;mRNA; f:674-1147
MLKPVMAASATSSTVDTPALFVHTELLIWPLQSTRKNQHIVAITWSRLASVDNFPTLNPPYFVPSTVPGGCLKSTYYFRQHLGQSGKMFYHFLLSSTDFHRLQPLELPPVLPPFTTFDHALPVRPPLTALHRLLPPSTTVFFGDNAGKREIGHSEMI